MPAYTITLSPYFDTLGPFERPLTHLVIDSEPGSEDPPAPMSQEPGEQWLCLLWSLMGGRQVGLFGTAGDVTAPDGLGKIHDIATLAAMAKTNAQAIAELRRWMKATKRALRGFPQTFAETGLTLWVLPAPFPGTMPYVLQDLAALHRDDADVVAPTPAMAATIDTLFDMGAMFWQLEPGHQRVRLETRFVGERDLTRHLDWTARLAGVELWPRP